MAIAFMRERQIVNHGIYQKRNGKDKPAAQAAAKHQPESNEAERRGAEECGFRQIANIVTGDYFAARYPCPEQQNAFQSDARKGAWILPDPLHCLLLALG